MGVLLGHSAVRRPAGVPDTGRRFGALGQRDPAAVAIAGGDRAAQRTEVAHGAYRLDRVAPEHRDPRAVIAAVFELLQAGEQQRPRLAGADIADDSAHGSDPPG